VGDAHLVDQRPVGLRVDLLSQQRDARAAAPIEVAAVARLEPGEHAQQRRLPLAVAPHQPDPVVRLQVQIDRLEQGAGPDEARESTSAKHAAG
jgi:hypothetical protein